MINTQKKKTDKQIPANNSAHRKRPRAYGGAPVTGNAEITGGNGQTQPSLHRA